MNFDELIRTVPDFPQKGVLFKDITPLLASHEAFSMVVKMMAEPFRGWGIENVVGVESRGFIFGAPLALELNAAFIPVRKAGKLPMEVLSVGYQLEYGNDFLEIQRGAVKSGQKTLIVDDVLATGGTMFAVISLLESARVNIVAATFLGEIVGLGGRGRLGSYRVESLVKW